MTVGYWRLPGPLGVAIHGPGALLDLLARRLVLHPTPPTVGRTVPLTWNPAAYRASRAAYWQPGFTPDDTVWREDETGWLFLGDGFHLAYSARRDAATFFVRPDRRDDVITFSYPFLNLLVHLLNPAGYAPLHGAVLGAGNAFVLVPGRQNAGKSTTAAAWVLRGGQWLTDDFCFVAAHQPTVAHGVYPTLRLRPDALPRLGPWLSPGGLAQRGDSKYLLAPDRKQFVGEAPLRAIFCPRLHHERPALIPVSAARGFEALASSVAFAGQYRAGRAACLGVIKKLVRELPVFELRLSADLEANHHLLREWLAVV